MRQCDLLCMAKRHIDFDYTQMEKFQNFTGRQHTWNGQSGELLLYTEHVVDIFFSIPKFLD